MKPGKEEFKSLRPKKSKLPCLALSVDSGICTSFNWLLDSLAIAELNPGAARVDVLGCDSLYLP
jgi:hypothetical protein